MPVAELTVELPTLEVKSFEDDVQHITPVHAGVGYAFDYTDEPSLTDPPVGGDG